MKKTNDKKSKKSHILQLVSFKIENEEFGIDIINIKEIITVSAITQVQNASEFIEGIINLRGKLIPVINFRTRLHLPSKEFDKNTRIIVVEKNKKTIGFIVDAVNEVLRIDTSIMEEDPEIVTSYYSNYIQSIIKHEERIIIIIDLNKVLIKAIMEIINEVEA